jgi:polynucleotide 5'-hydroxyl-kinase GRC3/NOL9
MISAVAARKAAQAELQNVPDTPHVKEQVAPTLEGTPRPNSKRKAPSQDAKPSKKKRVKKEKRKHAELPKERYFTKQKDDFKDQEDMIVVDSDDDDENVDELSQDSDLEPGPSVVPSKTRRKWSPSRMVEDSSEEDSAEVSAGPELDLSPFFPRSARKPVVFDENRILSTFQPTTDQNTFVLTAEEVSALDSSSQNVGGTILILTPADSLCILGACLLTVVHGSISLCGSTLHSSSIAHRIYAPRSSPLPIIRHAAGGGSIAGSIQLPHRFLEFPRNSAIILLRELPTGVEGLGQICRSFEGVFEPSKWQKDKADAPFEFQGLYMVSCSFFQHHRH